MIDFESSPLKWEWSREDGLTVLSATTDFIEYFTLEDTGELYRNEICVLLQKYHLDLDVVEDKDKKYFETILYKDAKINLQQLSDNLDEETNPPNHTGCPSYPNCDESPLGCIVYTEDVEWYGHRD